MVDKDIPVIGLLCGVGDDWRFSLKNYSSSYANAIIEAGGVCKPIGVGRHNLINECDGIFVPGGWDIHPRYYKHLPGDEQLSNEQVMEKYKVETEKMRDGIELRCAKEALAAGMPYLGICRGFQTLNIVVGRKLIPDICAYNPNALIHFADKLSKESASHEISIIPGSIMEQCYGKDSVVVNSRHHQGITADMVSDKLKVTALAPDGIVEAVEGRNGQFIVGVQWHPERKKDDYINGISGPLFKAFVDACREYRQAK